MRLMEEISDAQLSRGWLTLRHQLVVVEQGRVVTGIAHADMDHQENRVERGRVVVYAARGGIDNLIYIKSKFAVGDASPSAFML